MATTPASGLAQLSQLASRRTIPFEHAFRYRLTGVPRNVINQTVRVSVEATFVAVAIGYGVIPKASPVKFSAPVASRGGYGSLLERLPFITPLSEALGEGGPIGPKTAAALRNGVRLNPIVAEVILMGDPQFGSLDPSTADQALQVVAPAPEQIQFLYAIFDEGTGREFQSDPILNIASLGISDGERPFRHFVPPISFAPQSTIRMQVTEISEFEGDLHVSLQGYKVLGGAGTPTGRVAGRPGRPGRR